MYTSPITKIGIARESPLIVIGPSFRPPSASATPSATPRITTGNDHITSSRNLIPVSVLPRRKPASTHDQRPCPPAVEQAHHHVATVGVRAEEELALPGRADRDTVESHHVRLLAVDDDRVGQVVLVGPRLGD